MISVAHQNNTLLYFFNQGGCFFLPELLFISSEQESKLHYKRNLFYVYPF